MEIFFNAVDWKKSPSEKCWLYLFIYLTIQIAPKISPISPNDSFYKVFTCFSKYICRAFNFI